MFIYQTLWAALKQLFKKQMNENVSLLKKSPELQGSFRLFTAECFTLPYRDV